MTLTSRVEIEHAWVSCSLTPPRLGPNRPDHTKGPDPMNPNKALWERGDFTRIAQSMRDSGEALVGELAITSGMQVLDLGCGDGTTALPAAKLGADVLG